MRNRLEYKGYHTDIEIDFEGQSFYGEIEDIRDFVNFESDTIAGIVQEFHSAVDDYLEFCRTVGKQPNTPQDMQRVKEYALS